MRTMNLSDLFCLFFPFIKTFTRIQITPFTASRHNFFLGLYLLTSYKQSTNVPSTICFDHRVVKLVLRFNQFKIGPGYWKFNNDLLDDDNYISFIKQAITNYKSNNPAKICNPQIRRDTLKCMIRDYTIQYSTQKRRCLLMKQKSLEQKCNFCNIYSVAVTPWS